MAASKWGFWAGEYGRPECGCCSESGEGLRMWEKPERTGRARAGMPETTDAYEGRRTLRGGSPAEASESPAAKLDEPCCCW